MAQFYKPKRRRGPAGPNKNEKKVLRDEQAEKLSRSEGTVGQRFPHVQKLTVYLDFLTPQQHIMDQQTRVLTPADNCDFSAPCPGRCGHGSFDLSAKVTSVLEARQARAEGSGVCQEILFPGSKETCGFLLRCRIEASYSPAEE